MTTTTEESSSPVLPASAAATAAAAPENLSKNISKALTALLDYEQRKASTPAKKTSKKNLLADDDDDSTTGSSSAVDALSVYLSVAMKKIPEKPSLKPHRLAVPHPWRAANRDSLNICLITKDPHQEYKQRIRAQPSLAAIKKVMPLSKLRTNFKPFEAKRKLAASYDLFLADNRIVPLLPKLLGKKFFEAKKQPVVVDLTAADLEAELSSAVSAALLFFSSGPSSTVKIGNYGQGCENLLQNCEAVIGELVARVPGGWDGIKSLHIKTNQSISLPIF